MSNIKKILTIGAGFVHPPTDGMILLGTLNVLRHTFPEAEIYSATLEDFRPNFKHDFFDEHKIDLIVQTGSPFIWDGMHASPKWENFKLALNTHPLAQVIMLGIGSCFPEGKNYVPLDKDVVDTFKDLIIITRDRLANVTLATHEIKNFLLPCPAFLSIMGHTFEPSSLSTAVWYDPRIGIALCDWQNSKKFEVYRDAFKLFIDRMNVTEIFYCKENEHPAQHFGPDFKYTQLNSAADTITLIKRFGNIMSGRVHVAVPAFAAHRKVMLAQVDSRAHTLYDFENEPLYDLINTYKKVITNALGT